MAKGTFIVVVRRVGRDLRPSSVRMGKPATLKRDEIAVRLTVEIPDEAFQPLEPTAVITIPLERTRPPVVEVTGITKPAEAVLEVEPAVPA